MTKDTRVASIVPPGVMHPERYVSESIVKTDKQGICWNCGDETPNMSFTFNCFMCSEECDDKKMDEYNAATASGGIEYTTTDDGTYGLSDGSFIHTTANPATELHQAESPKALPAVRLRYLAPGSLFKYGETLALKTEYRAEGGRVEAYILGSGEAFYGGQTLADDVNNLMVIPVSIEDL